MKVDSKEDQGWTEPGQVVEIWVPLDKFGTERRDQTERAHLKLRIVEVLEAFEGRRVLVARAEEILEVPEDLDAGERAALSYPPYLIEETCLPNRRLQGWPEKVEKLVRAPVSVVENGALTRSVFVDNVGISVGDLVDLVRGKLELHQVKAIFEVVASLVNQLHEAGWIHLGLTPWNVRIFDRSTEDGFPRLFVSDSLGSAFDAPESEGVEELLGGIKNPFVETEKTIVELDPLQGFSNLESEVSEPIEENAEGLEEFSADLSALYDSEVDWSEPVDTRDVPVEDESNLAAIFDGIDRLYQVGKIDDEIAVTQGFSAPELLTGMGSRDGESADIFSLGMFLYFLVAGEVPPASVYTRYAPALPARNFRPSFLPGLQAVIARATRPRPDDRFGSVQAMMEAFEEAVEVIEVREDSQRERPLMRMASDTHIGIAKGRRNPINQDAVFSAMSEDRRFALLVVADGVSTASYGSGDLASHFLTEVATQVWEDALPAFLMEEHLEPIEIINQIMSRANYSLVNYVNAHFRPFRGSPHEVMGSTALVAVILDGEVTLGALGDSRVYLHRGSEIEQLTIDHNLWTLSILEGMHADSALAMPHGDALARCLGTFVIEDQALVAVDPQPDLFRFTVTLGETLLMPTDGLIEFGGPNSLAAEDNILAVLVSESDPALACLELILLANRGGGGDNLGLAVIRFH